MSKKIIIFVAATLFSVTVLTALMSGCSIFAKPAEITFKITWDNLSARGIAIEKIVDRYNESQKKIHVTMIGGSEDKQEYLDALLGDTADVFVVPYRFIKSSDIAAELSDVSMLYAQNENYYYDTIKDLAKYNNDTLGVPWIGHSMGLIYNKDILDAADIDPEEIKSLEDLLIACEKVKTATGKYGVALVGAECHDITWMVSQFIYSFGGELASYDAKSGNSEVLINSQQSEAALDYYINSLGQYAQDGWHNHTGVEAMQAFGEGGCAFEIQGPWGITDIWKRGNPFEVGALPLYQLAMYSEVGPLMLSVSKDSQNMEQCEDFIKYLTSKSTLEMIMDGEYDDKYEAYYPYRVPLRKDMEDSQFFKRYPEFMVFIEGYKMPSISVPTVAWENKYNDSYSKYVHMAVTGEISILEALDDIANQP